LPILIKTLNQTRVAVEKGYIEEETKEALLLVVNGCQTQILLLDNLIGKFLPREEDSWILGERRPARLFSASIRMPKSPKSLPFSEFTFRA
jgi:N-terminal domain on NACHT_NTPase and P-loop NTPases